MFRDRGVGCRDIFSLGREAVDPARAAARSGVGAAAILMGRVPNGESSGRIAARSQAVGVTHLSLLEEYPYPKPS